MFPVTGSILSVTSFQDYFVHRQLVHKRPDQLVKIEVTEEVIEVT